MISARADTVLARNALGSLRTSLLQAAEQGMLEGLEAGQAIARGLAVSVVKRRTGALYLGIGFVQRGLTGKVRATAKHSRWVEDGTRPHIIEGRNGGMLRFVWNGVLVFRRRVHHPGTKPTRFMARSADPTATAIANATQRHTDYAARRFSR